MSHSRASQRPSAHSRHGLLQRLESPAADDHLRPALGELDRRGPPEPAAAAGHQRDLARQQVGSEELGGHRGGSLPARRGRPHALRPARRDGAGAAGQSTSPSPAPAGGPAKNHSPSAVQPTQLRAAGAASRITRPVSGSSSPSDRTPARRPVARRLRRRASPRDGRSASSAASSPRVRAPSARSTRSSSSSTSSRPSPAWARRLSTTASRSACEVRISSSTRVGAAVRDGRSKWVAPLQPHIANHPLWKSPWKPNGM